MGTGPRITVVLALVGLAGLAAAQTAPAERKPSLSVFPILMYDSDIGFGYGGKAKGVDYLGWKESLDLILFNSTKGERWYVFTFSVPDFEIRQGKRYGLSFDLKAEYDKYLKYSFFGFGQDSLAGDETVAAYERQELQLTLGRGFSPHVVLEAAYVFRQVNTFDIEGGQPFSELLLAEGKGFSPYVLLTLRYDTSDSQIHPKKGIRLLFQNDLAGAAVGNRRASYYRWTVDLRSYTRLLWRQAVLAARLLAQKISGPDIPVWEMSTLGGGSPLSALRGYRRNRFTDKGKLLADLEYRFPIWKKVGGNVFVEAGCVWPAVKDLDILKSAWDAGWGLRYYLANFVVRFDMGFSREGTAIYFNFGHLF